MGFGIVQRNSEDLCIVGGETTRLITERANFRRSATSEIARIERQHDVLFALERAQLVCFSRAIGCDKIGAGCPSSTFGNTFFNIATTSSPCVLTLTLSSIARM